jgi:uncharacterized membrane protein
MQRGNAFHVYMLATALGAIAGARSATAPATLSSLLARQQGHGDDRLERLTVGLRPLLYAFAFGEMVADKLPFMPDRTSPTALLGRLLLGGASGALVARAFGENLLVAGALAAGAAYGTTFACYHLRRLLMDELGMDGITSGMIEDTAVVAVAAALVNQA